MKINLLIDYKINIQKNSLNLNLLFTFYIIISIKFICFHINCNYFKFTYMCGLIDFSKPISLINKLTRSHKFF